MMQVNINRFSFSFDTNQFPGNIYIMETKTPEHIYNGLLKFYRDGSPAEACRVSGGTRGSLRGIRVPPDTLQAFTCFVFYPVVVLAFDLVLLY